MRMECLLLFLLLFAAPVAARGEMWTNQAGRVIEARLGEFDGIWVTLLKTNSSVLKVPLSALCEADQRRVRLLKGQTIAPPFVQSAYLDAASVLRRFERLPADQQTLEGWKKAANMACSVFDARISARSAQMTNQAVLEEVQRLRAALARGGQ
jgi:hypothetical protein